MSRMTTSGAALFVIASLALPSTANAGFFDQLFGGGQTHSLFENQPAGYGESRPVRHHVHHPRKIVEEKPAVQAPTDLMHDKTLRFGDAVMTASGIKIFTGERQHMHDADDFTALQKVTRINPKEKLALAEINAVRTGQVMAPKSVKSAPDIVTGRSAAVTGATVEDVTIKDHDGKTIRYVGP